MNTAQAVATLLLFAAPFAHAADDCGPIRKGSKEVSATLSAIEKNLFRISGHVEALRKDLDSIPGASPDREAARRRFELVFDIARSGGSVYDDLVTLEMLVDIRNAMLDNRDEEVVRGRLGVRASMASDSLEWVAKHFADKTAGIDRPGISRDVALAGETFAHAARVFADCKRRLVPKPGNQ